MPVVGYKAQVAAALPGTMADLVRKTGFAESTIRRWLRKLRKEGACHVGGWRRSHGGFSPRHVAGPGPDVPCNLQAWNLAQQSKRWRERVKKEESEHVLARQRVRAYVAQVSRIPQHPFSALFMGGRHA